ncbi:hypothetical protein JTE90_002887 [Oedothorax gibbosus]|uniref:Exophilin 5 n=1 Tax=Oedothorax gibbosus TaxID=931172 RepID=A0AAV6VCB8_9ARAC|nr:hypothetical protein JTE90_002887 [Oedothorax gibbosus]
MTARLKDSQEGPSFTLPPHQSNYSKMPEPRNEWNPSTNTNLKFGRHRSQSSSCYSRLARQNDDLEGKKCGSQAYPNAATSRRNPENTIFKSNKTRPQDERSKIPILCGKNRDHLKEQTKTTYSNIPIDKIRKNVSIFSGNATPSPKLKSFENFGKQLNPGNLTSKPVNNTKCYKRMVSLIERLDQVCLLDDMHAGDSNISEYENPNATFKKYYLKSITNKKENSPVNHKILIKADSSLLKTAKKANLSAENNLVKRGSQLSKNATKLSKIQTTAKDKVIETKGTSKLIGAANKKNVLLKNKNDINNSPSFSKTTVDSIDYKTTYSTLSEASTSSSYFDETKNTFDLEEDIPSSEEYQVQFISTQMASTYNSNKLSVTTFPTKTKLRQIPIQMPSKIPWATSKLKYTKGILKEPINDLNDQKMSLDEAQATEPSSKQQISRQNQTKSYIYQSSRIPIAIEKLGTIQKSLKPMKNKKTDSSSSTTDHKYLTNQSTIANSGDVSCKDRANKKVSTWLQNLSDSEDKKKLYETREVNDVDDSDFKEFFQGDSMEQTESSSKIPTLSEHRNGKIAIEFGLDNRSCSSLPHSLEPTTKAHVKNRKSVVDSDMLMGKSNDSSIENEFFEAPIQKFMDVFNSAFSDIEYDDSIKYYV